MRRIVIRKAGGYERLELQEAPDPQPGAGQVRIAVRHIGVNYADVVIRMGLYASAKKLVGWPITPGFEVAGAVDALGAGVSDLRVGDAVIGITLFGGYTTSLVLPRAQVFRIPQGVSSEQAAGIPTVFLTAWFALNELAHVRPNEKVLIHSAAGGVGSAAVQIARIGGASAVAVVGAAHKRELPLSLGACEVIVKSQENWRTAADRISASGYDVILDANGAETLRDSYRRLAPLGRLVVYGFHTMLPKTGGKPNWLKLGKDYLKTPRFDPLKLTTENRSVLGFNLSFVSARTDLMIPAMARILDAFAARQLQSPPVKVYPLAQVAHAHRDLESAQTQGKLVLAV
jgi:NADPH:quinone reductase-like Zn-dependent oxidoreductase